MVGRTLNDFSTMRGFPRRIIRVGNPFESTFHLIEPGTLVGLERSGIVFSVAWGLCPRNPVVRSLSPELISGALDYLLGLGAAGSRTVFKKNSSSSGTQADSRSSNFGLNL